VLTEGVLKIWSVKEKLNCTCMGLLSSSLSYSNKKRSKSETYLTPDVKYANPLISKFKVSHISQIQDL